MIETLKLLILWPLFEYWADNMVLGSVYLLAALTVYFYIAWNLYLKTNKYKILWIPTLIIGPCFFVFDVLCNLTAGSVVFRDLYMLDKWKKERDFKLTDVTVTKRLCWYNKDYSRCLDHFDDWRDKAARFLIRVANKIAPGHV